MIDDIYIYRSEVMMMTTMMMNRHGCGFEDGRRKSNFDCTVCCRNDDCTYGEISYGCECVFEGYRCEILS